MAKRTVMGVYAPPPRLTRTAKACVGTVAILVIVLLGLVFDPVIYALMRNG